MCLENNITIIRFIEIGKGNDYKTLKRLIRATTIWEKKAGAVIIDQSMVNTTKNSLMMSILGTLSIVENINIYVYEKIYNANKDYRGVKLDKDTIHNSSALYIGTKNFRKLSAE